jgi:hypothetical protein
MLHNKVSNVLLGTPTSGAFGGVEQDMMIPLPARDSDAKLG